MTRKEWPVNDKKYQFSVRIPGKLLWPAAALLAGSAGLFAFVAAVSGLAVAAASFALIVCLVLLTAGIVGVLAAILDP